MSRNYERRVSVSEVEAQEETMNSIAFGRTLEFLGRNGVARMAGLAVEIHGDCVCLAPVTSKGRIGRAYLLVPRENVGAVADIMVKAAGRRRTVNSGKEMKAA